MPLVAFADDNDDEMSSLYCTCSADNLHKLEDFLCEFSRLYHWTQPPILRRRWNIARRRYDLTTSTHRVPCKLLFLPLFIALKYKPIIKSQLSTEMNDKLPNSRQKSFHIPYVQLRISVFSSHVTVYTEMFHYWLNNAVIKRHLKGCFRTVHLHIMFIHVYW